MGDAIRPSEERYRAIYEQGFRTWYNLYLRAKQESGLPQFCFLFQGAFQQQPRFPHNLDLRQSYNSLCATGVSSWETGTLHGTCSIPSFEQHLDIPVSIKSPTPLMLRHADHTPNYRTWFGKEDNHLSVLILAWAYILSARWAELMPESTVRYTDNKANLNDSVSVDSVVIDVGDVDEEKARWWAAILAPREGWQTDITSGKDRFRSPWSIAFQGSPNFVLSYRKSRSPSSRASATASFTTALRFLSDYCTLHDIADQSLAALSAALFLPFLNRREVVSLPAPTSQAHVTPTVSSRNNVQHNWDQEAHHLDKLLTLSCNIKGIRALLSSAFYEPSIACNLVSPWLQSTFAVLDTVRDDQLLLAHILMSRVPGVAFLWLGGIIMGIHEGILRDCRFGLIAIDLHAAAWSGTVQSFMQEPVSKYPQIASNSSILRADECRLLFLTQAEHHTRLPVCQWMPFGATALKDTDLDVRVHAQSEGGRALKYGGWKWTCKNGAVVHQKSNGSTPLPASPIAPEQWGPFGSNTPVSFEALDLEKDSASENATRSIFGWLRFEGYPPAERDIHGHPWVKIEDSDDEEEPPDFRDSKSSHLRQPSTAVEAWIAHHLSMLT